ncbi:MAG: hypothetical protein KH846_05510 [Leptotrichia wadei]|uniref:hypothetical protein n=1 Tax=Leptotrichia wadei TaxID=157687 RepID=UPI0026EC10B3|nr:hypothetical protein [Leptotrichia wadei]MBS6019641.1 hypothetical protein [Leptotrichia wadei]
MDVKEVRKIKVGLGENTIDKFIEESDILKNFPDKVEGILEENENNKKIFDVGIGEKVAIFFKKELYDARSQTENIKINNLKLEIEDFKNLKLKLEENGGVQIGRWIKVQQISDTNNKIYDLEEKLKKIEIKFLFYANGIKEFVKKYLLNEISLKDSKELEKIKENYKNYFKNYKNYFGRYIEKDEDRFNGQTYENEIEDINKGSWDIFDDLDGEGNLCIGEEKNYEIIEIEDEIYARNPKYDIVESGIVGIDFGTKSTVVVSYRDDNAGINNSKTLPIRISGNMNDIERTENYENATIIHFSDLESFIEEYNLSKGRPYTYYEDIQVSLEAENELKRNTEDFDINEFMLDLKQWASSKNKKKKIRDEEGFLHTINGYLDLKEGEFDPIEIYAYYIGCRINNMAQYSIFLEYYLSFPVTYELEVKNRILNSFRKGIMKSLPNSILNDEEVMKRFRVVFGASEPASYAITALKKFCVEPDLENEIGYSVFDFGGGTTDFSYGIYREKENSRKYDYEIQELESGGDKYLGGENLLALIAFDVFLQNREKLVNGKYFISLPANKKSEIGFETFVSEASQAEYNMKKMMEAMRDYWEGKLEESLKDSGKVTVYLSNKENQYKNEELDVDYDRLDEILKKNIYGGIISFLEKFDTVFNNKKLKEIYIFLAGNSSKSKFVEEIFENELTEEFKQKYNIILKNAYSIEEETEGKVIGLNSKTGVAFGLVELREGNGEVEYIPFRNIAKNEEINFKYCLGYSKKRRFIPVINFNTKYNEWMKYDDVEDEKIIEVLYSGNTRAEGKEFPASECSRIRILVQDDDKGSLFIRLKNPSTIEYVICEDVEKIDEEKIVKREL